MCTSIFMYECVWIVCVCASSFCSAKWFVLCKSYPLFLLTKFGLWFFPFRVFSDRLVDEKDYETFVGILTEKLGVLFDQTFHNICHNKQPPIFGESLGSLSTAVSQWLVIAVMRYSLVSRSALCGMQCHSGWSLLSWGTGYCCHEALVTVVVR